MDTTGQQIPPLTARTTPATTYPDGQRAGSRKLVLGALGAVVDIVTAAPLPGPGSRSR